MKFRNPNAADCVADAMIHVDFDHHERYTTDCVRLITFTHDAWRKVLHDCESWMVSQGSIDPMKMTFMGCPVLLVREQDDPFHIWVRQ